MAIVAGFANQSRMDYLLSLGTHSIYCALYLQSSANMDLNTPTYTTAGEITGTGYSTGGKLLTGANVTQIGNSAVLSYTNPKWTAASFTTNAAVIYDATNNNHILGFYVFPTQSPAGNDFILATNNGVIQAT